MHHFVSEIQMEAGRFLLGFCFFFFFFNQSRKITSAPEECSGRWYVGFQLWDRGTAAKIILLESAGEQGECQAQHCQARCLHPAEVKRNNFFHYYFFTYSFRLTWRHLTVLAHLKLWRKRCANTNNVFAFQKSPRTSPFLANSKVTFSQPDRQKDKALTGVGETEGLH